MFIWLKFTSDGFVVDYPPTAVVEFTSGYDDTVTVRDKIGRSIPCLTEVVGTNGSLNLGDGLGLVSI